MAVSLEQFVVQLQQSGLVSANDLESFIPPKGHPADVQDLARQLVHSKHLTKYQVQEIYRGRGKLLVLGKYAILDTIGDGRLGQIHKGQDNRSGRLVTITFPPPSVVDDRSNRDLLTQRVAAAAKLQHPNLIVPLDFRELDGRRFVVADFVEGTSLAAMVKANGSLSIRRSAEYSLQAVNGLAFAHARNLAHGDVRPANLLVDRAGTVKLLGLGLLPAAVQQKQTPAAKSDPDLGSLDYIAPEVRSGNRPLDPQADIYSLGCALYYLLAGVSPFACDTAVNPSLANQQGIPRPLLEIRPDVPQELSVLVARMLSTDPADRPQTPATVAAALLPFAKDQPPNIKEAPTTGEAEPALADLFDEIAHTAPPANGRRPRTAARRTQTSVVRRYWLPAAIASAAMLGGIILFSGVFKARTAEGTIALHVSQPNAEVLVDGQTITVHWSDDGKSAEITAPPGKHRVEVKKQGFVASGTEVTLQEGAREILTVVQKPSNNGEDQGKRTATSSDQDRRLNSGQGNKAGKDAAFQQWMNGVAAMPAQKQVDAVAKKLQEFNSGFDGKVEGWSSDGAPEIEYGTVVSFGFSCDKVDDLSPVRALKALRNLRCSGSKEGRGILSDLSPLNGMKLKQLDCRFTSVSDLSPLKEMELAYLAFGGTLVADLSPLQRMPLVFLDCSGTKITDLSPLGGMSLTGFFFTPANITNGIETVRRMQHLTVMGISPLELHNGVFTTRPVKMPDGTLQRFTGGPPFVPFDFWRKYDAGEFGKPDTTAKVNGNSAPVGGAAAGAGDLSLPTPIAHFHFQNNCINEASGEAKWELQNAVFKDDGLYVNGLYDVRNGGPTQGYHAVCSTPSLDPSAFTVALRFKGDDFSGNNRNLLTGGAGWRWFAMSRSDRGNLEISLNNRAFAKEIDGARLESGKWHVVACAVDMPRRKIVVFLDGTKVADYVLPDVAIPKAGSSAFQDRCWSLTNYGIPWLFKGLVNELLIFDRALTAEQLEKLNFRPTPSLGVRPIAAAQPTVTSQVGYAQFPKELQNAIDNAVAVSRKSGGAVVAGRVLGEDGRPVGAGEIVITLGNGQSLSPTNDGGWFVHPIPKRALAPSGVQLLAGSFTHEITTTLVPVREGEVIYQTISVRRPAPQDVCRIHGTVTDDTGRPVAAVPMYLETNLTGGWLGNFNPRAVSDAAGQYEFRGLAPRQVIIDYSDAFEHDYKVCDLNPGSQSEVNLKFPHSKEVTLDYVFQKDGSRSFQGADLKSGTILFKKPDVGFLFAEGRPHANPMADDLALESRHGQLAFRAFYPNGTVGFYDAGATELDGITEAHPTGYDVWPRPCIAGHVYVVRTYDGHYAKFLVRSIADAGGERSLADTPKPASAIGNPAFQKWMKGVAALPAEKQAEAVAKELRLLNPEYDGKETHLIRNGVVTSFSLGDGIADISPVRALTGLRALTCQSKQLSDLSPLRGLPLNNVYFHGTSISDLSPIKDMPLNSLECTGATLSDLSPLKGMHLTSVHCSGSSVSDLSPLKGMQLTDLSVDGTRLSDLSPLEGMPLRAVDFSATKVADLTPLKGMQLAYLSCSETLVSDLTPLSGMHLTGVTISVANITKGIDVLRAMKMLQRIGDGNPRRYPRLDANEFWKKYDAGGFASQKAAPAAAIVSPAK